MTPGGAGDSLVMDADLALALSLTPQQQAAACGLRGGSVGSAGEAPDDRLLGLGSHAFDAVV